MEFLFAVNFKTKTLTSVYNIICLFTPGMCIVCNDCYGLAPYETQKSTFPVICITLKTIWSIKSIRKR